MKCRFLTGSYATADVPALHRFSYDPEAGFRLEAAYSGLLNPSYALLHPDRPLLYTVEETEDGGQVHTWRREESGLAHLCATPTGGTLSCHLAPSADWRRLYVSNYGSGSLATLTLDGDGMPTGEADLKRHAGSGPNPARQEGPHVHCALERDGRVYACDLGLDKVFIYAVRAGRLEAAGAADLPGGCGPRHLAVHPAWPELMYCVAEMGSRVFALRVADGGGLEIVQSLSALPEGADCASDAAAIHFTADGRFLMASNRGHDSIAVYRVAADGRLEGPVVSPVARQPRDFLICGDDVIVGGQRDSELRVYRLDRESGRLEEVGWRAGVIHPVVLCPLGEA